MIEFPRLALATPAAGPEPSVASLCLLAGLTHRLWRVQHFRTRACPTATEAVGQVTGLPGRHLDAWLMPPSVCRGLFARAARSAELAVVEGTLDEPISDRLYTSCDCPGDLKPIAEALDLPIVAVVSCRGSDAETFHLPRLPDGVDAVLLDELADPAALPRLKRLYRLAAKLPVIGAIETMPAARAALEKVPRDRRLPDDLIEVLAHGFWKHTDEEAIGGLARRPTVREPVDLSCLQGHERRRRRFRVAYAQDEAFGRYFPDTIEALEALGADLVEFSPLRDERLPVGVDLAMIGYGMPDRHADELASNVSMIAALREHVCRGRRIYSEGGGTAYLGRRMIIEGRRFPGAGILPFDAELLSDPHSPAPVTRTLLRDCWLGPRGTTVRGYKSGRWRLIPSIEKFECPACFGALSAEGDWFYHHHAVGSLLHLHLGALPEVVDAFAGPHSPSLWRPSPCDQAERELDHVLDRDSEREATDPRMGPES
ncbi:MAG TPA: cobyrinic acid a,c-diamide synthase [Isosphaeraceae bacterium]|nr:cobyrinic acid a,c-diamide synthase [Isosphaeraceae bacterium]